MSTQLFSLSDSQLDCVMRASAMLPVNHRAAFVRSVANQCSGIKHPTNHDIETATRVTLSHFGISVGPYARLGLTKSEKAKQRAEQKFTKPSKPEPTKELQRDPTS